MTGPPPPPFSASWTYYGKIDDKCPWSVSWHLSIPGATGFDYASVHRFHEDLLTISEPVFSAILSSGVTSDLSRLIVNGPASSVGDELFLLSNGARGDPVPAAIAVPVRQIIQAPGKGRSGRFFLPPPTTSDVDFAFQLTPGAASTYASNLTFLFNEVNSMSSPGFPNVRFAVLHRREHGAFLPVAQVQPVDTWVLSRRLGTQRRRMARVAV